MDNQTRILIEKFKDKMWQELSFKKGYSREDFDKNCDQAATLADIITAAEDLGDLDGVVGKLFLMLSPNQQQAFLEEAKQTWGCIPDSK